MKKSVFVNQTIVDVRIKYPLLQKALAQQSESIAILTQLVEVCIQLNYFEEAIQYSDQLFENKDCHPQTMFKIAQLHHIFGHNKEAKRYLNKRVKLAGENERTLVLKAKIYKKEGNVVKSKELCKECLKLNPKNFRALSILSKYAYVERQFEIAEDYCEKLIAINPQKMQPYEILNNIKFQKSKADVPDYRNIVRSYDLSTLSSLGISNNILNKKINDKINENEYWVSEPKNIATTNGDQLSHFFNVTSRKDPYFDALEKLFRKYVYQYINDVQEFNMKYFETLPMSLGATTWAVRLNSGGYQKPHTHQSGWISAVYYTQLPFFEVASREGALEFGLKDQNGTFRYQHHINPKEGLLVLFPSYCIHRTVPFDNEIARISIAFDVFPK